MRQASKEWINETWEGGTTPWQQCLHHYCTQPEKKNNVSSSSKEALTLKSSDLQGMLQSLL